MTDLKIGLASLYRRYNRRAYVHPDPLEMLYRYDSAENLEIAGLLSACLAYGRVAQILASVTRVLDPMAEGPRAFLERAAEPDLRRRYARFKHRFTTGKEVARLLIGVKRAVADWGSLENLFRAGMSETDDTVLPALAGFVERLRAYAGGPNACPTLLASPLDGSACKRLNLYLRWMVRRDAVDPGPWRSVPRAKLIVPLDTHMFKLSTALGLTARKQADLKTAVEITRGFARCNSRDPVRYDFSLTRLGINPACRDDDIQCLLKGSR